MSQQPEEKKTYVVNYRATVNVIHNIQASSPQEAYRFAETQPWNAGEIEADEVHAITVSYWDEEKRKTIYLEECDLNLEDDEEETVDEPAVEFVWLVATSNYHGLGASAHETRELAMASLYEEVKRDWARYCGGAPISENPDEVIQSYFEASDGKWDYFVEQMPIERAQSK